MSVTVGRDEPPDPSKALNVAEAVYICEEDGVTIACTGSIRDEYIRVDGEVAVELGANSA